MEATGNHSMNKNGELVTLELFAGVQIVKFVVPLLFFALVVILLVFLAISVIWAAFAFLVDWWFVWCGERDRPPDTEPSELGAATG